MVLTLTAIDSAVRAIRDAQHRHQGARVGT
jgi:hypothetical protein